MIDLSKILRIPVLFKRGTTQKIMEYNEPLEYGRLLIEKTSNGKIRLIAGDGLLKPSERTNENRYIGEHIFNDGEVATVAIGGITPSSLIGGRTALEVLRDIVSPYQQVSLTGLTLNKTLFEIGFPISGSLTVSAAIQNIANLAPDSSGALSSTPALFPQINFNPRNPFTVNVSTYTRSTPGTVSVHAQILGSKGETSSKSANITWAPPIYFGSSTLQQINNYTQLQALGGKVLSTNRARDYNFTGPGYNHIGFASAINIAGIQFIDNDFPTAFAMQAMPDLIINNGYISMTIKMFRSINYFNGQTSLKAI